jgi:NhaA family Na+:H+ antiporter
MPSPGFSPAIWIKASSWMTAREIHSTDRTDLFGGIALGIAALAALGIANSALAHYYDALIHVTVEIRIGSFNLTKSLEHWVNDGLMAIFFLLVGLEIKREVIDGSLASGWNLTLGAPV